MGNRMEASRLLRSVSDSGTLRKSQRGPNTMKMSNGEKLISLSDDVLTAVKLFRKAVRSNDHVTAEKAADDIEMAVAWMHDLILWPEDN